MFGNRDLADSLLSIDNGGAKLERALKQLVDEKYQGSTSVSATLEPGLRSDLLLQRFAGKPRPEELAATALPASPLLDAQFGNPPSNEVDVVVISLGPDVTQKAWRHKVAGYLLSPPQDWENSWSAEQQSWLQNDFEPMGTLAAAESTEHLLEVIRFIKGELDAHVIIYNCSTVDPDDRTHNYHGVDETVPLRIQKLNRSIIEISVNEGISIIDADRLIAELGGRKHVPKVLEYSTEACQALCEEFLRVMEDIGFFEKRPLIMQVGRQGK